jgi:hypothetical protein
MMKKIAMDEHFMAPQLEEYWWPAHPFQNRPASLKKTLVTARYRP